MSYNSKYKGSEVEALLSSIGSKQDIISDLESIRDNASKGAQALGAIPTKVSELVNDAKYASAEDTDDVVEEPEGGGSAGGSNVYTLDIGEWDMASTKELTITAADIEGIGNADTVRVLFKYDGELSFPFYLYPTGEMKFVEEGALWWTGNAYSEDKNILVNIMVSEGEVYLAEISAEDIAPYQPVFGIGMYDEDTDSWTSLTDANEIGLDLSELIELNKTTYNRIKEIGYDGVVSGMVNSPLVFQFVPISFEPTTMMVYDDDETGFVFGFTVNVVKNDGTISRWNVYFNEDGIETYAKYGE